MVLSNDVLNEKILLPLMEFMKKVIIITKTIYPSIRINKKKKIKKQEPIGIINTFYKEKFNVGGLRTVFGLCEV